MITETELEKALLTETRMAQRQALLKHLWRLRQSQLVSNSEVSEAALPIERPHGNAPRIAKPLESNVLAPTHVGVD